MVIDVFNGDSTIVIPDVPVIVSTVESQPLPVFPTSDVRNLVSISQILHDSVD